MKIKNAIYIGLMFFIIVTLQQAVAKNLVNYEIQTPNKKPLVVTSIEIYTGPTCNNVALVSHFKSDPGCKTEIDCQDPNNPNCAFNCVYVLNEKEGLTSAELINTIGKNQGCYIEKINPEPKEGRIEEQLVWDHTTQKYKSATPNKITRIFTAQ